MAKKREILTLGTRIAIGGAIHGLAFGELSLGWYFDGGNVSHHDEVRVVSR